MAKKITKIPATLNRFNLEPVVAIRKRRVAGYARVSTDRDEQATSYEAQMAYYNPSSPSSSPPAPASNIKPFSMIVLRINSATFTVK